MPEIPDISFLISLKPEQAIEYLFSKGFEFAWDWTEIWEEAHSKAFTVAKVMRLDILQDIKSMVQKALVDGITAEEFRRSLAPILKRKGWYGKLTAVEMLDSGLIDENKFIELVQKDGNDRTYQLGSPYRLNTIYKTNMQTSYMAGRFKTQYEDRLVRPYWMYVAILDEKTRPLHKALNGKVFMWNDPFWKMFYPPNGWGCRCRVRALDSEEFRTLNIELSTIHTVKFQADPGWNYNPGQTAFYPDFTKYDDDIASQYEK